jgi:hypothetical protein
MFPIFPEWQFALVFGFPAAALGVVAGGLACLILRQRWGFRAALIDAVLAFVVWEICSYVTTDIAMSLGTLQRGAGPGPRLDHTISTASVVVRHLIPRCFTVRTSKVDRSTT